MGDIPLWPFFLPNDHPNKRDLETLSTLEAQQNYAVNMIIPLIKQHLSSIRTNTSNGLRKYASLHTYVDSWLKKWAGHVDVKQFWNSPMGYKQPSYGTGGPAPSSYPSAPSSYPSAPSSYPPGPSSYTPGPGLNLRTPGEFAAGAAIRGAVGVGQCAATCLVASAGECCTVVGGRRKKKRKTVRRRHSKKRTRKTRRV